jgi:hypothetical protein
MLSYIGVFAQPRPETFIPVVGAFVGGADMRMSHVIFQIDSNGVLTDIISSQHESGAGNSGDTILNY